MKRFPILCLALLITLSSCTKAPQTKPNILLLVVDALRADRLGCYGQGGGLTSFLDSLAARGTVFHNAYAQAPWTNSSIASLLTSRYEFQHAVSSWGAVLAEEESTLAELLHGLGYATGFSANIMLHPKFGFSQGYDVYKALPPADGARLLRSSQRAHTVNRFAMEWLEELPTVSRFPYFLHLHYMEPHTPYDPPQAILDEVFRGRAVPDVKRVSQSAVASRLVPIGDEQLQDIVDFYDAEIMSLDRDLQAFFEDLEKRGFLQNTLILITADHGEELKDHGFVGHGQTLYNEVIRVPLIVLSPGQQVPVNVREVVSLVDIAPTLLDWLDAVVPSSFEGRSFKHHLPPGQGGWLKRKWHFYRSAPGTPALAFSELSKEKRGSSTISFHRHAVVRGSRKLIAETGGNRELYDLDSDPTESRPSAEESEDRTSLEDALKTFPSRTRGATTPVGESRTLDAETREHMRVLGYLDQEPSL